MPTEPQPSPHCRFVPWRSAGAGWIVAVLALVVGVPFFLCLPPWVDVTLYDMATRSILRGGVYYRDIFDTNLPGISWAMAAVRFLFGWSYEALRAVDLLVIAAEVALLLGWVRRAGASASSVAWLAAAVALFYPYSSEFSHMQRDSWMLLPALVAARMRLRRVTRAEGERTTSLTEHSTIEGFFWGAAVWIKPHVVIPAFLLWVASVILIRRQEPGKRVVIDFAGLLVGGVVAGGAGVAWLVGTGAWPYFLEVFLEWNPNYVADVYADMGQRAIYTFEVFRPWGLLHNLAIPLALLALWEGRLFSRRPGPPRRVWGTPWLYSAAEAEAVATARLLLAVMYLGWLAQAVVFQRGFEYVQVPVLLLGMAVIATHRLAFGFVYLLWFVFLGVLLNFTSLVPPAQIPGPGFPAIRLEHYYPLTHPRSLKLWPRCWREGSTPEMRNRLGTYINIHCGVNWERLEDVARFLRTLDPPLGPGELNCWNDSTHSLYLMLDLEPATRYMHFGTVMAIDSKDDWVRQRVAKDVRESRQRYVVADLARMVWDRDLPQAPGEGGDPLQLPRWFPDSERAKFPWNQKLVFRSGRYVVFEVVNPLGEIGVPDWLTLPAPNPALGK
ncbi:MAG: hypothetical protein C0467_09855 [Planctomycetaceae bacterium]|nr:hypothetical protein [Planctomycetaceae bacterium]